MGYQTNAADQAFPSCLSSFERLQCNISNHLGCSKRKCAFAMPSIILNNSTCEMQFVGTTLCQTMYVMHVSTTKRLPRQLRPTQDIIDSPERQLYVHLKTRRLLIYMVT